MLTACGDAGDSSEDSVTSSMTTVTSSTADSTGDSTTCPDGQMTCGSGCSDTLTPDFDSVYNGMISKSCGGFSACHANNPAALGFDADTAEDFIASAINVPSSQEPSLALILPGDPENSYLIRVLRDPASADLPDGARSMPPGQPLCDEKIDVLAEWIRNGALTE